MSEDILPQGKTCADCKYWRRCSQLIDDLDGSETHCDWAPSRFKENLVKESEQNE